MPPSRGDFARRLDNQDAVGFGFGRRECADFAIELVAKDPDS